MKFTDLAWEEVRKFSEVRILFKRHHESSRLAADKARLNVGCFSSRTALHSQKEPDELSMLSHVHTHITHFPTLSEPVTPSATPKKRCLKRKVRRVVLSFLIWSVQASVLNNYHTTRMVVIFCSALPLITSVSCLLHRHQWVWEPWRLQPDMHQLQGRF